MADRGPHRLALFSLKPLNERAHAVLHHRCNEHLVSWLNKYPVLDIGHIRSKSGTTTLATLGRGDADVFVEGSSIGKIQCSFEIEFETGVVMFYDRSHSQTSQVSGPVAFPFEYGRPRKVVVQDGINTIIGMGGTGRNLVQFELEWRRSPADTMEIVRDRESTAYEENPRLARTIDDADTVLPSRRETRPHTPGTQLSKLRTSAQGWRTLLHGSLKREVEILSRISHPHVVDYIASWGWDGGEEVEIFMGLKEGTLESLVTGGCFTLNLADTVFHHMLQAIDCLATKGIIHRDVKPENILYVSRPGGQPPHSFQLGDFGVSNGQVAAATFAGSPLYMAPEMFRGGGQTHKVDVWSLYVTMLWTLDVRGFREASRGFQSLEDVRNAVLKVASEETFVSAIREMARISPEERASAAQMLVKCFGGQGLTTPKSQVPPLASPAESSGATTDLQPTGPSPPKPRRKKANPVVASAQFRVEKVEKGRLRTQPKQWT